MAAVPPVSRDALTHHLAVPKLWIEHGGIHEIPSIPFSYFPMNLDLLYVIPLLFGNDIVPKYIHFLFGSFTAILIFLFLKKRTNLHYSLLGALLFLSTPVIVKLSISVYVDLGFIFFSWASIYYLCHWIRSSLQMKFLVLSAVSCGLAMGTKYNGLLVFCLLTLSVPLIYIRTQKTAKRAGAVRVLVQPLVFMVFALAVFSPWMIRNFKWTGNPVYPLYHHVFSDEADEDPNQPASMKPWLQRKLIYHETALETALIPIRIFFQGQDDNPKFFDGKLNPILIIFPLLAFIGLGKIDSHTRSELVLMGAFSVFYLLYASFVVDMRIRYIAPVLPPLVVLTVMGIKNAFSFADQRRSLKKIVLVSVIGALIALNGFYMAALLKIVSPVDYIEGKISRAEYIEKFVAEYPVVETANHLPDAKVKLLALFLGNRRYYFDKDVEFAAETFKTTVAISAQAQQLAASLSDRGFTHLIVGASLFKTWAKDVFKNEELITINRFFDSYCRSIDAKNGYILFAIRNPIEP